MKLARREGRVRKNRAVISLFTILSGHSDYLDVQNAPKPDIQYASILTLTALRYVKEGNTQVSIPVIITSLCGYSSVSEA